MLFDILVVLLAAAGVVFLIRLVFGLLLMPVRGKGCRICVTVSAEGATPDLERVVRGAKWLAQEASVELVLIDKGLDKSTRKQAERLARDHRCFLCTADDVRKDPNVIL